MDFAAGDGAGHDMIEFDISPLSDFASVMAHAAEVGSSVVITFDAANAVTLQSASLSDLVAADFRFV